MYRALIGAAVLMVAGCGEMPEGANAKSLSTRSTAALDPNDPLIGTWTFPGGWTLVMQQTGDSVLTSVDPFQFCWQVGDPAHAGVTLISGNVYGGRRWVNFHCGPVQTDVGISIDTSVIPNTFTETITTPFVWSGTWTRAQ